MRLLKPIRFFFSCAFCLILTAGLAVHSAGTVLTHKVPETAAKLFPLNGLAQENLASAKFSSSIAASNNAEMAARSAEERARSSYRIEPLVPESHAILAIARRDERSRSEVVNLASRLNRRDPRVQALVLQEHVAAKNYAGTVEVLDRILRVRPIRSGELFPVMLTVFVEDGAVQEFAKVLDGTSPWHQRFVGFAARRPAALPNLVELRTRRTFGDQKLDQILLRNLAREGYVRRGYDLYNRISDSNPGASKEGNLSWASTYEPFDWDFTDNSDFRAQTDQNSDHLELYVRPGNGGVFARRIIETPNVPFTVTAQHRIIPRDRFEDVRIGLRCTESSQPFIEHAFGEEELKVSVEDVPAGCSFVELVLQARAWSGKSALRGTISPLKIGL